MNLNHIVKPTLLLDKKKCCKNIELMALKAKSNKVIFRPHFKTHQSRIIGKWFKKAGVNKITVSSLSMASYFANDGWNDITVAFPVNIREIEKINELAEEIQLNIAIENIESVDYLNKKLKFPVGLFIKIDTGYHRTGLLSDNYQVIDTILEKVCHEKLQFKGFLTHSGNTYQAKTREEIIQIYNNTTEQLTHLKNKFIPSYPDLILSAGDTPSCSIIENLKGIDEIRPGNFIFYDLIQYQLGSCHFDQVAVCMACPVVAIHKERNEVVIYGGGVHFSKESLETAENKNFGQVVLLNDSGWKKPETDCYLSKLSQEHGTIKATDDFINSIKIGDLVGIIPVHSCMTANLMRGYLSTENELIDHFSGNSELI
ncbi:MAG: alanine racemase [Bacteroidetes bacterium GWC2_33_15]|nr:MAG: alanine racemase [Bacteroidetes bacterium GWA2_33_15]OFX51022.1 MAG: alanine racemase [Bacteroidetes bacterium GWC2_33_15]OFX65645.1 MAG: alanine racemase [Bacteroidetes bacterium GWB2_32_14]OFX70230.1 MAG: alanine racemase [Bacteroidetes bacterium GWD2_33_33]HAN17225.1 alanine racemase [Bacteroidales bacterium]